MMSHDAVMMQLHMRMLADPVIRERLRADTALMRMMRESMDAMPAEHREHMRSLLDDDRVSIPIEKDSPDAKATAAPVTTARPAGASKSRAPTKTQPATKKAPTPTKKPADPHAGHKPPN